MHYEEAWSYLDQLQFFKIKLGLDSMADFLDGVDHPQKNLKFIHVAGTNGKGSVSVTLLSLLSEAGLKVGLYTSPHLSSVRERFRINDKFISKDDFALISTRIRESLAERKITYFEFTTALALLWFAEQKVDIAILEVGLGGRLDATNVITPLVSVITNVSMDHEAHLGTTLRQVATEKAGIIKSSIPVVSGVALDESHEVVSETCRERGAPLFLIGRDFKAVRHGDRLWDYHGLGRDNVLDGLRLQIRGDHQIDNTAIALATLDCLADYGITVKKAKILSGLAKTHWPGRLEYFCRDIEKRTITNCEDDKIALHNGKQRTFLLDGAHNPAGVACLADALLNEFHYNHLICVWASMSDKDISKTLNVMAPLCHTLIFCRPEEERSATPEKLSSVLMEEERHKALSAPSVKEAIQIAEDLAGVDDLICVAGSLYLIGAARKLLLGDIVSDE